MWSSILLSGSVQIEFTVPNIKTTYMETNTTTAVGYYS